MTGHVRPAPPLADPETRLEAIEESTPHGVLWLARATYPDRYRHGRAQVASGRDFLPADLALVSRERAAAGVACDGWLVLDVESTGLGAHAGTIAFLVGIGAFTAHGFVVEQLLMRDPSDEPALLHALAARLERAPGLVTFNGKAFDLPLLSTRFAMARRSAPHARVVHCDLLHTARRLWARGAGECRLGALERRFLGVRRGHDVAGRDVPDLYLDYLRGGSGAALDAVLRHNRADLLSLMLLTADAARFPRRARDGFAPGSDGARDRARAARLHADAGATAEARALYAACLGSDAPRDVRQSARAWLARTRVRGGDLAGACALWRQMLEEEPDLVEPVEALAKTFEHRLRDPARALAWVDERLAGARLVPAAAAALAHRRARLTRKLGGIPPAGGPRLPGEGSESRLESQASLDRPQRTLLPFQPPASEWGPSIPGSHVEASDP